MGRASEKRRAQTSAQLHLHTLTGTHKNVRASALSPWAARSGRIILEGQQTSRWDEHLGLNPGKLQTSRHRTSGTCIPFPLDVIRRDPKGGAKPPGGALASG